MAEFSATDAALEGFRLTRERPRTVLVWAALMLLASLVSNGLIVATAGEAFTALMQGGGGGDPDETVTNMRRVGPAYGLLLPLGILFSAVITAAIYRALLHPSEGGPGFLRFGGDELRLAGALVLVGLLIAGAGFAVLVVVSALVGGLAAGGGGAATFGGGLIAVLLILSALIFLSVRFSLALPATFAERRIRVFESWRLTKGRFWPLLGAYVLSFVLAFVVLLLALMIYLAIAALVAGGVAGASSVFSPDFSSFTSFFSLAMIIYMVVTALVSAVTTTITTAPPAAAYRDITGYGQGAAEVFS
ncbi:MAG: hypothetical protein KY446_11045 [Proteobacteria bacterium]|nr:hypothetical protein [Pseudomonadota bacterium]